MLKTLLFIQKLILFFTISILPQPLCAKGTDTKSYFDRFYVVFSSDKVKSSDYDLLFDINDNPSSFVNYDMIPPEPMQDGINLKKLLSEDASIIFNGLKGKRHFLMFIKKSGLMSNTNSHIREMKFKDGQTIFEYSLKEYSVQNVVINANIISPIPDSDMVSEMSCEYRFSESTTKVFNLSSVNCAG